MSKKSEALSSALAVHAAANARLRGENDYLRTHVARLQDAIEADVDAPAAPAPAAPVAAAPAAPVDPVFPATGRGRLAEYQYAYARGKQKIRGARS